MEKDMEDVDRRYEWLHSHHSSVAGDIFGGEPHSTARIGDEYQAQIPFMMTENEDLTTSECGKIIDAENRFRFGLSIPVIWIHNQHNKKKEKKKSLVPGSSSEAWSAIEHASFVLGLYIFGKNLGVVNKFVGDKGMRNVLCYYYGKFYRSGEHQKWSRFRKKRSRKSVPGKKIFNGWRRHELLSRLLPNLTDECKTMLTQVTRMFEEEKISLEEYVVSVRDTVGMTLLVEAVAIGKGKRDLSGRANKSMKNSNKKQQLNGSACASLEPEEILNVLKEGIGLISKERLNEIFWEAVWPRLLERGWHSEHPTNYAFQDSSKKKQSVVFVAPGITKFSRRGLEKGSQYFDSYTQLLNKVASEPSWLLNLPDQGGGRRLVVEEPLESGSDDFMKYTIVDTSLAGWVVQTREVTHLQQSSSSSSVSGDTTTTTTQESQDEGVNRKSPEEVHGGVGNGAQEYYCETTNNISAVNLVNPAASTIEEGKPVRKLKLICKPKATHQQQHSNDDNLSGEEEEDESMEDPGSKKKKKDWKDRGIVIDLNNPRRVGPDNHETTTDQPQPESEREGELLVNGGQRQSRRNRPLSMKALEALANGFFLNPQKKKRKRGESESEDRTTTNQSQRQRQRRAKTALVSSCGARYIDNRVADGVFKGASASCMLSESPK